MSKLIAKRQNMALNENVIPFLKENGGYAVALIGLVYVVDTIYNLTQDAMVNGYEIDLQAEKNKISLKFSKPNCA